MQALTPWSFSRRCARRATARSYPIYPITARTAISNRYASTGRNNNNNIINNNNNNNNDNQDQTVLLPDGRNLGFAEYGSPNGYPLFFFHGFPSSRLEARGLNDIGYRHNIRVVAPDRPGFGLSTFQPSRLIKDYPVDIQYLAQHLGVNRFAVLGGSGGGPYALACAHTISPGILSAVGMISSAAPWESGTQDVLLSARLTSWAATHWPSGLCGLTDLLVNMSKRALSTSSGKKMVDGIVAKSVAKASKGGAEMTDEATIEARRNRMLRTAFEGFAQGSKGFVQEAYLLTHPWGFSLEDVKFNTVKIWHGTKDKNSPIRMIRYMKERLPHSQLHEYEGANHFAINSYLEDIVTDLIPEQEIKSHTADEKA